MLVKRLSVNNQMRRTRMAVKPPVTLAGSLIEEVRDGKPNLTVQTLRATLLIEECEHHPALLAVAHLYLQEIGEYLDALKSLLNEFDRLNSRNSFQRWMYKDRAIADIVRDMHTLLGSKEPK